MPLSWNEIKSRALAFSRTWADAASEDSEAKPFWMAFFEIFGITDKRVATFELNVKKLGAAQGFVDLFWPGMLLVEHKSRGKDLNRAFAQALDYFPGLPERDLPQLIIVCDFARFRVHRLATGGKAGETVEFALADLHKHIKLFGFVAGYRVQEIKAQDPVNVKAAERMGRLHDALKASQYDGHPLEVLLVRLLFCLFADDTGIFQPAQAFRTFIEERTAADGSDVGPRLAQLFQVLNTPEARRSPALDAQLASFPYINGKLFAESLPMADFTVIDADAADTPLPPGPGGSTLPLAHLVRSKTNRQIVEDDALLEMCDKLGMLAWEEIPIIDIVPDTPGYGDNCERNLREMIRQHYNHPSIITWGYMNEILLVTQRKYKTEAELKPVLERTLALANRLERVLKEEDSTRISTMAFHGSNSTSRITKGTERMMFTSTELMR